MEALNTATLAQLATASSAGIADVFSRLRLNFATGDWLGSANRYRDECIAQIRKDVAADKCDSGQLADYIAASIPLHCLDGWTFLARALTAYVRGNAHQAAHFAYYAELRAAMSILASQGIGVFSDRHFVVDQIGCCSPITQTKSTHKFAWLALEYWSKTPNSGTSLLDLFVVANATIKEWLEAQTSFLVASAIAQDWLRDWGLDLRFLEADHNIRNLASYRPNVFSPWSIDARRNSDLLRSFWNLFEPGNSRFESIDRQLLKLVTSKILAGIEGDNGLWLRTRLDGLPIGSPEKSRLREFLTSKGENHVLIERLSPGMGRTDPFIHERVMARAALLLRVSSGFTAKLIDQAPFAVPHLRFWTDPLGTDRGFWSPGDHPEDLVDLWTDIAGSIEDETAWVTERLLTAPSMYEWRVTREQTLSVLTECDRIGLWGLQR